MEDRTARGLGAAAVLGAVLSVVTSVPSAWYGAPATDAFVFQPAVGSPLWVERTLVPAASLLAGALLLAGVAGLLARDWAVAGRLRRWGGVATIVGLGLLEVAMLGLTFGMGASRSGSELVSVVLVLGGALAGLAAVVLLVPGMVATGVGYVRADRPVVGYALAGGAGLSVLATAAIWVTDPATSLGFLPSVLPFAAAFVGVGHELWTGEVAVDAAGGADDEVGDERPTADADSDS